VITYILKTTTIISPEDGGDLAIFKKKAQLIVTIFKSKAVVI
jgi:hypothetical protein